MVDQNHHHHHTSEVSRHNTHHGHHASEVHGRGQSSRPQASLVGKRHIAEVFSHAFSTVHHHTSHKTSFTGIGSIGIVSTLSLKFGHGGRRTHLVDEEREHLEGIESRITAFDDPILRRGLPSSRVLSCFGQILANSKGSEDTFSLSKPVDRVSVFISHNWSTPRLPKFLTLVYHFNFYGGLVVSVLVAAIMGVLISSDVVRVGHRSVISDVLQLSNPNGYECCIAAQVAFVVALLWLHDILRLVGWRGPIVFLDKACIHQTDSWLQRQGIERLSAFLCVSDELLIVYTDTYMRKLWTVYELASMLILQPHAHVLVVPTCVVFVMWTIVAFFLVYFLVLYFVPEDLLGRDIGISRNFLAQNITSCLALLPLIVRMHMWSKRKATITSIAELFSIRSAKCTVESDRKVVYQNVHTLMRAAGYVSDDAEEDVALDAFDFMARDLVPRYLQRSWGRSGMPLRCALCSFPALLGVFVDFLCSIEASDRSPLVIVSSLMFFLDLGIAFALVLSLISWLADHEVGLRGYGDACYIISIWLGCSVLASATTPVLALMMHYARSKWEIALIQMVVTVVLFSVAVVVYSPVKISPELVNQARHRCSQAVVHTGRPSVEDSALHERIMAGL